MNLYTPTGIGQIMERFGFSFSKKFGQNFLINEAVVEKIADASYSRATGEKKACIEIGPGIGSLTAKLAQRYDRVVCIEIDDRLPPVLQHTLAEYPNVKVILADALQVNFYRLVQEELAGYSVSVCANPPYYITSQIVTRLLEEAPAFCSLVLMVQKEAAARLVSAPGQAEYGSIAACVSYYAKVNKLFDVQPGSFMPRPRVVSTVLAVLPYSQKPVSPRDPQVFLSLIRASFAQRRKTLINSLVSYYGPGYSKESLLQAMKQSGVAPTRRGETLSLQELCRLSDALSKKIES